MQKKNFFENLVIGVGGLILIKWFFSIIKVD